jgi:hypothetical protein
MKQALPQVNDKLIVNLKINVLPNGKVAITKTKPVVRKVEAIYLESGIKDSSGDVWQVRQIGHRRWETVA